MTHSDGVLIVISPVCAGHIRDVYSIFDRSDISLEWATLEGCEISEALVNAVEIVDATLVVFTPRDQDPQWRVLTGNSGSKLIRDASVPVMAVPDQTPD